MTYRSRSHSAVSMIDPETEQRINYYYQILEIELAKKSLDVPQVPLCSPDELMLILQKMVFDTRGYA